MDDAFVVGGGEAASDLHGVLGGAALGERTGVHLLAQGLALQQFRDEIMEVPLGTDVVDGEDVGVVDCAQHSSLILKALQPLGVASEGFRQNLDRHLARQTGVAGAINLSHAASTQQGLNFIRAELGAGG
jgi:hypothetical protein